MATRHIGLIVTGCLIGGIVAALALIAGPVAGAQEHVITGSVLLALGASWALLAALSMWWTDQPQRWALAPASFMTVAATALLVFAPGGAVIDALGWVWPPTFLALVAGTAVGAHRRLYSRTRRWVVYPLLGMYAMSAVGGACQTVREAFDRRGHAAPGQFVDVGGHRLHLHCAGSGTPTIVLEPGLGETGAYRGWISAALAHNTKVCTYDRAGRGWSDPASLVTDQFAAHTSIRTIRDVVHAVRLTVRLDHL